MAQTSEAGLDTSPSETAPTTASASKSQLDALMAEATLQYSIKSYSAAAELYSQATELQVELNGEMSSENADLLYFYGRCLYHVGVSQSDVLGSKLAGEKQPDRAKRTKRKSTNRETSKNGLTDKDARFNEEVVTNGDGVTKVEEEVVTKLVEEKDGVDKSKLEKTVENQPYFQFTGDENWDDSDDEEDVEDAEGEVEAEAEDDDFTTAYEVLDLARVLLTRKIEASQDTMGKGKAPSSTEDCRQVKERLADTYDLQAEICLENERYPRAVKDLKSALTLKQELYDQDSNFLAEAHYKLSLALEFSSVNAEKGENAEAETGLADEAMREEAAKEMEAAIESCELRVRREEQALAAGVSSDGAATKGKITNKSIQDVKEMIEDMEQRLKELREPSVSLDEDNPLGGILGSLLGESPAAQKARLEEASKSAKDLTGLVRRKKPTGEAGTPVSTVNSNGDGKRKVEFADETEEVGTGKKVKIEDAAEEG
ncbi:MAG: hypothetical protein M1827_004612 [Pycnora praestabilis]|nr:MAG: hypothetical protein M1827_004612 [Pycnora praestabilis]